MQQSPLLGEKGMGRLSLSLGSAQLATAFSKDIPGIRAAQRWLKVIFRPTLIPSGPAQVLPGQTRDLSEAWSSCCSH